MVKKKNPGKKSTSNKKKGKSLTKKSSVNIEKKLMENFIGLQKVMVNLSASFEDLSKKISKLLQLFEISAKALAEKDFDTKTSDKIVKKIDNLLDQNKTLARGMTLIHERMDEPVQMPVQKMPRPRQMPRPQQIRQTPQMKSENSMTSDVSSGGYQKSISSQETNPQKNA